MIALEVISLRLCTCFSNLEEFNPKNNQSEYLLHIYTRKN